MGPSGHGDTTIGEWYNQRQTRAFSFSGLGYIGPVFPAKAGIHITAAYGNFPMARLYGFPPARE